MLEPECEKEAVGTVVRPAVPRPICHPPQMHQEYHAGQNDYLPFFFFSGGLFTY